MIAAEVYQRVVRFVGERGRPGTGVIVEHNRGHFLVTAKHLCTNEPEESVSIHHTLSNGGNPFALMLARVGDRHNVADVAAFELPHPLMPPDLPMPLSSVGMVYTDDAYILGFPFGLGLRVGPGAPGHLPFVKRGIVSSSGDYEGAHVHYLDIFANPGFSGGPGIVRNASTGQLQMIGVVKGQLVGPATDTDPDEPRQPQVPAGITAVTDIRFVIELLEHGA